MTARPTALLLVLAPVLAIAACAPHAPPPSRAQANARQDCQDRADQVFALRNPGDKYRTDQYVSGQRDSPFGGSVQNDPTADIQARYQRDQLLADCLRRVNAQPNP